MKLIEQPVIDNSPARQRRRHDHPPVPPPSPSSPGVHYSTFKDPISCSASPLTSPSPDCSWSPSGVSAKRPSLSVRQQDNVKDNLSAVVLLGYQGNLSCSHGWITYCGWKVCDLRRQMTKSLESSRFAWKEMCNFSLCRENYVTLWLEYITADTFPSLSLKCQWYCKLWTFVDTAGVKDTWQRSKDQNNILVLVYR